MIRRFSNIFNSDIHSIHHAAFWLALFSLLSSFLGMFRDRLLAGQFGASRELDIYYAAFRVPDFIYTFMLLFAASTALIPAFLEAKEKKGENHAGEVLGSVAAAFFIAVLAMDILAFILMPHFISWFLPGFSYAEQAEASTLSRILLLSPFFLGLSNILSSFNQSFGKFFAYGLSPVFYNVGIIFGILVFFKSFGLPGLALGVILGAMLHFLIQIPPLFSVGIKPYFKILWDDIKKITFFSLPRTLGLEISQVVFILITAAASTLLSGSIAIFNLASNLEFIPITVIGLSYSIAAFPVLAEYSLKKDRERFEAHFGAALRHILFWAIPFSILLLVLRAQIVRVILGSGEFSWTDTRLTAASLLILSFAVVFQSVTTLLVRAFHAEGDAWPPLVVSVVSAIFSVGAVFWWMFLLEPSGAASLVIARILRISDIPDIRVISLSFGLLSGVVLNFILLFTAFKKSMGEFSLKNMRRSVFEIIFASAVGGVVAYSGLAALARIFDLTTFLGIFMQGLLAGIFGISAWISVLLALKNNELAEVLASFSKIFAEPDRAQSEHKVPAPEQEKL